MFSKNILIAASAALMPLASASEWAAPFIQHRSADDLSKFVSDGAVFQAFSNAGHPSTIPTQTWEDNNGSTYQSAYIFDTTEWNAMRSDLLKRAGVSEEALAAHALTIRQSSDDPPQFFCKNFNENPRVYTVSLSMAAGGVCQAFVYGTEQMGKTQIIQRNVPDVNNGVAKATFKFIWYNLQWATATACAAGMGIGLNEACTKLSEGNEGEQPATTGFEGTNDGVDVAIDITAA